MSSKFAKALWDYRNLIEALDIAKALGDYGNLIEALDTTISAGIEVGTYGHSTSLYAKAIVPPPPPLMNGGVVTIEEAEATNWEAREASTAALVIEMVSSQRRNILMQV